MDLTGHQAGAGKPEEPASLWLIAGTAKRIAPRGSSGTGTRRRACVRHPVLYAADPETGRGPCSGVGEGHLSHRAERQSENSLFRRIFADHEFIRWEEHKSELQSLMRISYAVLCLKI